ERGRERDEGQRRDREQGRAVEERPAFPAARASPEDRDRGGEQTGDQDDPSGERGGAEVGRRGEETRGGGPAGGGGDRHRLRDPARPRPLAVRHPSLLSSPLAVRGRDSTGPSRAAVASRMRLA